MQLGGAPTGLRKQLRRYPQPPQDSASQLFLSRVSVRRLIASFASVRKSNSFFRELLRVGWWLFLQVSASRLIASFFLDVDLNTFTAFLAVLC